MKTKRYTVLGNTDERTACDCCGRNDLKSTVALHDNEEGKDVFFGCVCAARAMGVVAKEVRSAAKSADDAKRQAERAEQEAACRVADAEWQAFLDKHAGPYVSFKFERCQQIAALGGYAKARALFANA